MVQTSLAPDARKSIQRLEQALNRLGWLMVAAALLIAGVNWHISSSENGPGLWLIGLALLAFLWGTFKR